MRRGRAGLWVMAAAAASVLAACSSGDKGPAPQSTTPPNGATTTAQPEPASRTVETTGLVAGVTASGEGSGATFPLRVTVAPGDGSGLSVAFTLSEVSEGGPMWESAGWTAVAVASLLLGIDPREYRFSIEPGGTIGDGPSAGGLTTVAVLAGILGDEVRADAAATGAINPDGTIGPVSGIPQKVQAAAEAGKKLVLVPASQHVDIDLETGEPVDVVELGNTLGIEVLPVSTIYEAYEVLTGSILPRPSGTGSFELSNAAFDKLEAAAMEWLGRYEAAVNRFLALPETFGFEENVLFAQQYAGDADQALGEGLAAVAYERASIAGAAAEAALQAAVLADAYVSGGTDALISEVGALTAVETRLDATLGRLGAENPRSATDVLALADAYANTSLALGAVSAANGLVQTLSADLSEDEVLAQVFAIASRYGQAEFLLDLAANNLTYGMGFGQAPPPQPELVAAIAEAVRHAADANLAAIDAFIGELANATGVPAEEARSFFLSVDQDYSAAVSAAENVSYFAETIAEERQTSTAVLGSSLAAWSRSGIGLAKYYSLEAKLDQAFNVTGFGRERALSEMLDLAEERADELLGLVAEEEPVTAIYYHENAHRYREGAAEDKLTALSYNWQAAILAQALAYFSGALEGPEQ